MEKNPTSASLYMLANAMMAGAIRDYSDINKKNPLRPKDIDVTPKKPIIQKGMKKFIIDGVEVYAINEKNAIKKLKKLK